MLAFETWELVHFLFGLEDCSMKNSDGCPTSDFKYCCRDCSGALLNCSHNQLVQQAHRPRYLVKDQPKDDGLVEKDASHQPSLLMHQPLPQ